MDMIVTFPGGLRVDSTYKGFTVKTDQPENEGGGNSAPSPFALFFHSIGTCAGFYVMTFCQERDIPTDGIRVILNTERDNETRMVNKVNIDIRLPEGFPELIPGLLPDPVDGADRDSGAGVRAQNAVVEVNFSDDRLHHIQHGKVRRLHQESIPAL